MYIYSEKELEDYICEHIDDFIDFLKQLYKSDKINTDNIKFVGRQVTVGNSRFDLLFETQEEIDNEDFDTCKTFIVVELKFRETEPKDIAQLSRYLNLLSLLNYKEEMPKTTLIKAKGILLTTGLNDETRDIQMYLNYHTNTDIKFAHIEAKVNFKQDNYFYNIEYLKNMTIDNRLKDIKKEVIECGEKTNDRPQFLD